MALYSIVQGALVNALDTQQIVNLLTGNMNDQPVTINNRVTAALTGSTNSSGYVGGTVSGAPASGPHNLGDFITDYTNGTVWVCTVAGTPGTFVKVGDYLLASANTWAASQTITGNLTINAGALDALFLSATGQDTWRIGPGTGGGGQLGFYDSTTAHRALGLTDTLATFRGAVAVPPSAGGSVVASSYGTVPVKLDEQLLGTTAASITFVNPLPTGFRHLFIEMYARGDAAVTTLRVTLRFNNDSGANYNEQENYSHGATNVPSEALSISTPQPILIPGASGTAGYFGVGTIRVLHYQGTVGNKLAICEFAVNTSDTTGNGYRGDSQVEWHTTATAITRIDLIPASGNFVAGSLFTLWGIP